MGGVSIAVTPQTQYLTSRGITTKGQACMDHPGHIIYILQEHEIEEEIIAVDCEYYKHYKIPIISGKINRTGAAMHLRLQKDSSKGRVYIII